MQQVSVREGEAVYVRAYSTQRAAIGELVALVHLDGREWGQVRLVTGLYAWDEGDVAREVPPQAGELLRVEAFRLEPVRH